MGALFLEHELVASCVFRFRLSCAVSELVGSGCRCVSKSLACAFAFRTVVGLVRQPLLRRVVRSPEPALRLSGFRLPALFGCLSGGSSCRSLGPRGVPLAGTSSGSRSVPSERPQDGLDWSDRLSWRRVPVRLSRDPHGSGSSVELEREPDGGLAGPFPEPGLAVPLERHGSESVRRESGTESLRAFGSSGAHTSRGSCRSCRSEIVRRTSLGCLKLLSVLWKSFGMRRAHLRWVALRV